ncbi:hypothetical protein ACJIZ3_021928 [Penstemon smallii]|uniref:Uncharacterized protein n=1 Tax=Penstemon smallii TaxID=265156 RepID=A0ABD3SMW8_9LAMI
MEHRFLLLVVCPTYVQNKMKVVAFLLIALMISQCLGAPRKALVGGGGQAAVAVAADNTNKERLNRAVDHPEGTIDNHHNIPRQYYNQWGNSPAGGDDGNNNDNGSG